jgi:proton-dependent oligopeptide transporter, POT family
MSQRAFAGDDSSKVALMRDEYKIMLGAWVVVSAWVGFVIAMNRKVHPRVLFFLFMVELWERFSYYGMRALLVLYLTAKMVDGVKSGFGMPDKLAYGIYAAYGALVYLTPLLGGYLADKILGFRKAIIWGAILMAAGQFTLATSTGTELLLYLGLGLLVLGNGFFKPNISSMIGRFYKQGDPRRDGAFTIFYMGINIGAFLTPLTCGTIGQLEGWSYGFLCAGVGMLLGLAIFLYTASKGYLEHHGDPPSARADFSDTNLPEPEPPMPPTNAAEQPISGIKAEYLVYLGTFLLVPLACLLIWQNDIMDYLLISVGAAAIGYMLYLSSQYETVERQRVWVIVVLLLFTAVFWTFFELAGSALNLFTDRNIEKSVFGLKFTTSAFQSVNAFFIMLFAPLFSVMWIFLARRNIEPPAPVKFAIGLLLLGVGFLVLNLGKAAAVAGIMPAIFLILLYLLHTLGELALSPVGLSLVTKLAPAQVVGFMMGFWFLSSAFAHQAGKWISNLTAVDEKTIASPEQTMELSLRVFNNVGLFAIGSAVLLLVLSPLLRKWMHGIK